MTISTTSDLQNDVKSVEKLKEAYESITRELGKVIVGQHEVVEQLLIAMFAQGHCLLVGVPGLAKTLLIRTLADTLSLEFIRDGASRVVCTPCGISLMVASIAS